MIKIFSILFLAFLVKSEENSTVSSKTKPNMVLSHMDSSIKELRWCGKSSLVLLALTDKASVYTSRDKGFTWKKINDLIYRIQDESNEKKGRSDIGEVQTFLFSPADPDIIIFQGTKGVNWLSEDCGESVKAMDQGRPVNEFQFHPFERTWMLAAAWTICDDFLDKPCLNFKELFVSFDLGKNWVLIEDYVVQFSWATSDISFKNVPKSRIILAHDPEGKGHQKTSGWNEKVHLSYSDDFFKTFKIIVKFGNKFLLSKNYFFVAYVINEETQDVALVVSDPTLANYEFSEVKMPMRRLKEHSYTILDTTAGQIFLHINHDGPKAKYGNLYISDSTGTRFALSIKHNARDIEGQCDFEKIPGLNGIYIANVYDEKKIEFAKNAENSQNPLGSAFQKRQRDKAMKVFQEMENYKKSVITFDMGGIWSSLNAPIKDSKGKKVTCKDDKCTLHLNSVSNMMYGPVYSVDNSVGLIMGTGNVGYYLATRADEINTYLSRDGGATWFEVSKGSHIYEFGDHGGLIVMASDQEATNVISYSWNEGETWEELKISEMPFEITNIIIEPTNTAISFVIYGDLNKGESVVVGVDFSSLHKRNCQGFDNADSIDSDYELWSPHEEMSLKCLMGKKVTYTRRKREAECFNTQQFERKVFVENCECNEEDWECDLGFERKNKGPCVEIKSLKSLNINEEPETCSHYYYRTQGYRKVAGDPCIGGIDHSPIKIPCSRNSQLNSSNIYILLILATFIGLILLVGTDNRLKNWGLEIILNRKNENFQRIEGFERKNFDGEILMDEKNERNEVVGTGEEDQEKNNKEKKFAERGALEGAKKNVPNIGKPLKKSDVEKGNLLN